MRALALKKEFGALDCATIAVVHRVWYPDKQHHITWKLVRNADSQDLPKFTESEILGIGQSNLWLN